MNKLPGLILLLLSMFFPALMSGSVTEPTDTITDSVGTDTILHSSKKLDEVIVSQNLVSHVGNTDSYVVTKKMLKDVHDTGELLGKIDGAFYNPMSTALSYLGSDNVIILIDSVERDQDYLKRLNPNRLARISVTQQPSGRFSHYDAVINLTTKHTYQGYDGVVLAEIKARPSHTEKSDIISGLRDIVETTYTRERWNIAFSGSYKRINECGGIWYVRDYIRNGYVEEAERPALDKPNRKVVNDNGNINLWIDYRINKRHSLSLGLNVSPGYGKVVEDLSMLSGNEVSGYYRSADRQRNLLSCRPSLNYRGWLRKWYAAAYFQYSTNSFDRLWSVEREDFGLTNDRHVFADYLWSGVEVSRNFSRKLYLSIGDNATFTRYEEKDLHAGYMLSHGRTFRNRLTSSLQYVVTPQFSAGINAGMDIYQSKYGEDTLNEISPVLGANLMYTGNNVMVRLNYTGSVSYPSLYQMQDYGRFSD